MDGIDELICKVETDTDVANKYMGTQRERVGGRDWEIGIDIYTLLVCVKQTTNEHMLYSIGALLSVLGDLNGR